MSAGSSMRTLGRRFPSPASKSLDLEDEVLDGETRLRVPPDCAAAGDRSDSKSASASVLAKHARLPQRLIGTLSTAGLRRARG